MISFSNFLGSTVSTLKRWVIRNWNPISNEITIKLRKCFAALKIILKLGTNGLLFFLIRLNIRLFGDIHDAAKKNIQINSLCLCIFPNVSNFNCINMKWLHTDLVHLCIGAVRSVILRRTIPANEIIDDALRRSQMKNVWEGEREISFPLTAHSIPRRHWLKFDLNLFHQLLLSNQFLCLKFCHLLS